MPVNLDGTFNRSRAGVRRPHCTSAGYGAIVQTASIYGRWHPDQRILRRFRISRLGYQHHLQSTRRRKAGVIGLTKHLATHGRQRAFASTPHPWRARAGKNENLWRAMVLAFRSAGWPVRMRRVGTILISWSRMQQVPYVTGQNIAPWCPQPEVHVPFLRPRRTEKCCRLKFEATSPVNLSYQYRPSCDPAGRPVEAWPPEGRKATAGVA